MNHGPDEIRETLDAYLDDLLETDERNAFERRLDTDPLLRSSAVTQQRIDATLRRRLTPPPALDAASILGRSIPGPARPARSGGRRRLALAAAVALFAGGLWMVWFATRSTPSPSPYAPQAWRSQQTIYTDLVASDFEPAWACRDDAEFAGIFDQRHGAPIVFDPSASVRALGIVYANSISTRTTGVLLDADGANVLVLIDRADRDRVPAPLTEETLHRHRRTLGPLVLYEIGPFAEPRTLGGFRLTEREDQR